jgi:hypothetical protein
VARRFTGRSAPSLFRQKRRAQFRLSPCLLRCLLASGTGNPLPAAGCQETRSPSPRSRRTTPERRRHRPSAEIRIPSRGHRSNRVSPRAAGNGATIHGTERSVPFQTKTKGSIQAVPLPLAPLAPGYPLAPLPPLPRPLPPASAILMMPHQR